MSSSLSHPNSKIVTIMRKESFMQQQQSKETEDYFMNTKKSIGSYWKSIESQRSGSGLTLDEETLLMPDIIDTHPDDKEFRKKVSEYFADISTDVPFRGGRKLEIGLKDDNEELPSKKNWPLNIEDYIRYRHIRNHPQVAASKELAQGNPMKEFYIFDKEALQSSNIGRNKKKDLAMQAYLKIKEKPELVNQMLAMMGEDVRTYNDYKEAERADAKIESLRGYAENKPTEFLTAWEGGDLEIKATIRNMVTAQVLKKLGDKYLDAANNTVIADSEEELVIIFKDEERTGDIAVWKAHLQEAMKEKIKAERRRTIVK